MPALTPKLFLALCKEDCQLYLHAATTPSSRQHRCSNCCAWPGPPTRRSARRGKSSGEVSLLPKQFAARLRKTEPRENDVTSWSDSEQLDGVLAGDKTLIQLATPAAVKALPSEDFFRLRGPGGHRLILRNVSFWPAADVGRCMTRPVFCDQEQTRAGCPISILPPQRAFHAR